MKETRVEQGFSPVELLVSMVIALIIAAGATEVLTSFYSGSQEAQQLANRVATASALTSIMDHTLGMQGYYDAATVSVAALPAESPAPTSATMSVGPVQSITVYWLPPAATTTPYCQGTLSTAVSGMNWSVSGPTGCLSTPTTSSSVFYPVGGGWEFYLVPNTYCNNPYQNNYLPNATAVVASNVSTGTEAVSCLSNP